MAWFLALATLNMLKILRHISSLKGKEMAIVTSIRGGGASFRFPNIVYLHFKVAAETIKITPQDIYNSGF
jgi:hypothetical protein